MCLVVVVCLCLFLCVFITVVVIGFLGSANFGRGHIWHRLVFYIVLEVLWCIFC